MFTALDIAWSTVLLSVETKVDPQSTIPKVTFNASFKSMVKHGGGSIMFCGCFSLSGTGALVKVEAIMSASKYKPLLTQNNQASARKLKMTLTF